ncbi:hypothetical protein [Sulfitobacter mediterraneus]|nr:hypothetical protein [Sulfitobacter mediterraneus]
MKELCIYLEPDLRKSAEAGEHNFINLVQDVADKSLFRVTYHDQPTVKGGDDTYTLSHMTAPPPDRGLVFRRAYQYPFWNIEATTERWQWDVAKASFDPAIIHPDAKRFYTYWQKRIFGAAAARTTKSGYIYVPLQGRLTEHRSFQRCSPIEMIEHCLEHGGTRPVVACLHPNETYSTAELAALDDLVRRFGQLSVETGKMEHHLQHCDFVVSQNSAAAFAGYFFGKPALLFGKIDFHHIAEPANMAQLPDSFDSAATARPAFDRYVHWFWQENCINAGRVDARAKILARFQRFGWPIE